MELEHKIPDNRAKHIMSVASLCYEIGKKQGLQEQECKKAFLIGYLHDIGYAFSKKNKGHPIIGYDLLKLCGDISDDILNAIKDHGDPNKEQTKFLSIINQADMQINGKGDRVTVIERLDDIGERYGFDSTEYINAYQVAKICGLL